MTANNQSFPTVEQIENSMIESMRNAGSIGTDFLIGKQSVTIEIKDIHIFAERIYWRIKGNKLWDCPDVERMKEWLKQREKAND